MKEIGSARHWSIAILVAMAAHASLLPFLLKSESTGARKDGFGGIEISLGPASGTPGAAIPVPAAGAGNVEIPAEAPDVTPATATAVTATPPPPATPVAAVPVTPMTAPTHRPVDVARVEPVTVPSIRAVEPPRPRPKPPDPVRARPPVPAAAAPPMVDAPPAPPAAMAEVPTTTTATAAGHPGPTESTVDAARTGAAGRAGGGATPADAGVATASGGGPPGTTADYLALLQAWLERHKEYPQRARFRRIEGTAVLYFMMDRDGRVLNFDIRRSSGSSILDEAVTAMIRRAEPLPAMPDDMPNARLELVVPIQFQIR